MASNSIRHILSAMRIISSTIPKSQIFSFFQWDGSFNFWWAYCSAQVEMKNYPSFLAHQARELKILSYSILLLLSFLVFYVEQTYKGFEVGKDKPWLEQNRNNILKPPKNAFNKWIPFMIQIKWQEFYGVLQLMNRNKGFLFPFVGDESQHTVCKVQKRIIQGEWKCERICMSFVCIVMSSKGGKRWSPAKGEKSIYRIIFHHCLLSPPWATLNARESTMYK